MVGRALIVQTFYPEFLADMYRQQPELEGQSYDAQRNALLGTFFGTGDAYSHGLGKLGWEATDVICNADIAQARWAREHGLDPTGNIHDRRRAIVAAQVEEFRPDVIFVFEWSPLGDEFIASLRRPGRLIVGQIASPLPANRTFRGYDLMVSSWPPIVEHFRGQGIAAEDFRLGFDRRILDRIGPRIPEVPVTFVGGFAPSHPARIAWLEGILREVDVDIYCYGIEHAGPGSAVRAHFKGQAWGLDMYNVLARSRITLNQHARIDVRGSVSTQWSNNMRLYEATGVGTCILTERRERLGELFEPGREVATYRDTAECIDALRRLLADDARRSAIARRGQERTLRDHTYDQRMAELSELFVRQLRGALRHA